MCTNFPHVQLLRDTKAVHSFLRVIIALLSAIMKTQVTTHTHTHTLVYTICPSLLTSLSQPPLPPPHTHTHQAQHSVSAYHAHAVQSFMLSLSAVVETSLYNVYCPLGGLVQLAGLWYKAFQQHSHRVRKE